MKRLREIRDALLDLFAFVVLLIVTESVIVFLVCPALMGCMVVNTVVRMVGKG